MLRRRQEAGAGGGATEARTCLLRVVGDRRRCRSVAVATTAAVAAATRVPGTEERGHPSLPRPPVPGERKGKGKAEPRNEVEPTTVEVRKTTVAPLSLSLSLTSLPPFPIVPPLPPVLRLDLQRCGEL